VALPLLSPVAARADRGPTKSERAAIEQLVRRKNAGPHIRVTVADVGISTADPHRARAVYSVHFRDPPFSRRQRPQLIERDRRQINDLRRAAGSALLVFDHAAREVVLRIPGTVEPLPISGPTVATAINHLEPAVRIRLVAP